ncbi:MAG: transaldolase family protein [Planctomycetota bacterium]
MADVSPDGKLATAVAEFVRQGFEPHFDELGEQFGSNPLWQRLRELGSELWLDTGNVEDAHDLWTRQFSALTTNNTLLNREVQSGLYDELIPQAARLLEPFGLSERERLLELAFILNARHGLRLVETFDAYVSVEEHTDLAHDLDRAVAYARRYHAICPERFIVKIPFTPAGLLATRRLAADGVPINHTLGFAARQNYLIARIGQPAYVNVFLGRLNAFVADNGLGDGTYVGERTTLASQRVVRELRRDAGIETKQIGASFRSGQQVRDLACLDVMTLPPKVARGFLDLGLEPDDLADRTGMVYEPPLNQDADPEAVRLDTLWDVGDDLVACVDALEQQDLDGFAAPDLVDFLHDRGCGDVVPRWTDEQVATSAAEGKIPQLDHWRETLAAKTIGLDGLMNLAGLNSFTSDQQAMDERVAEVLGR